MVSYRNLTLVFQPIIWWLLLALLLVFSASFALAYWVYSSLLPPESGLAGRLTSRMDFVLVTFTAFSEPDNIPWFPRPSTGNLSPMNIFLRHVPSYIHLGKLLVWLWIVFSFFITNFYQCNLRANLIAVDYEKPLDTVKDVLKRNKPLWLSKQLYIFRLVEIINVYKYGLTLIM